MFSGIIAAKSNLGDHKTAMLNFMPHVKHLFTSTILVNILLYTYRLQVGQPMNRGSILGMGKIFFFQTSRPLQVSTQPAIEWITAALSSGVNRLGRVADHYTSVTAEVKNDWSCTPLPYMPSRDAQEKTYLCIIQHIHKQRFRKIVFC